MTTTLLAPPPALDRLTEQQRLDALKTATARNELGQYATPPALARQIARTALAYLPPAEPVRLLEPSVGTGAFFEAFLAEQGNHPLAAAQGIELDPAFAAAAHRLWAEAGLTVQEDDFTQLRPATGGFRANLVLANPPYSRHHHLSLAQKRFLANRVGAVTGLAVNGLAGLYVHFLLLTHAWLAEDAVSAWLIPSEFMDVNYGDVLKRYLTENVTLLRLHRFRPEDVQFSDALVTSTVVFFRNAPAPDRAHPVALTSGSHLDTPAFAATATVDEMRHQRKWGMLFQEAAAKAPAPTPGQAPPATVGDAFTIRRGIATGGNEFFVRPLAEFRALQIPALFLRPVLPPPRALKVLAVETDAAGYPTNAEALALLDCSLPEDQLRTAHPSLWAYLQTGRAQAIDQRYLTRARSPWYAQEQRPPAPIVCTYMGRSRDGQSPFRFIENRSQATATNVYLLLYPRPWLQQAATADPALYARVCLALNALTVQATSAEGRVYGGGLHKLEPKELARLPLTVVPPAPETNRPQLM